MDIRAGTTSFSMNVMLFSDTSGGPKPGLAHDSDGVNISFVRARAARVDVNEVTQTVTGGYSSGGFVQIQATDCPGLYRFDVPDAALAAGVDMVTIYFKFDNTRSKAVNIGLTMVGTDSAATEAKQDIIDTNVDAILEDTGTTLPAQIAALPTAASGPRAV